ncbi:meckelin [Ischnura elegans]|uniref:meckelin n=1 Tax=Ischnura elegans TaxID=197161 RepID=UPI001ED87764|nr:meckelin [Ischnura elegans]
MRRFPIVLTILFIFQFFTVSFSFSGEILEYISPKDCKEQEIFSTTKLQCASCDHEAYLRPDESGYSCVCEENAIIVSEEGEFSKCRLCPSGHRPSTDKRKCLPCSSNSSLDVSCGKCDIGEIQVDREENGDWLKVSRCVECNSYTVSSSDQSSCIKCPFEVPFDGDFDEDSDSLNCTCPAESHELLQYGTSRLLCVPIKDISEWPDEISTYSIKYPSGRNQISSHLQEFLRPSAYLCLVKEEEKACQNLANMCVMSGYHIVTTTVTDIRRKVFGGLRSTSNPGPCFPFQPTASSSENLPWIFYGEGEAPTALGRKKISALYGMRTKLPNAWLNLTAARYAPDGAFIGLGSVPLSKLSLCPMAAVVSNEDFFRFGAPNKISCKIPLRYILNHSLEFMDLFLSFQNGAEGGSAALYALPILSLSVRVDGSLINQGHEESQWQLVRRLFLIDAISGIKPGSKIPSTIQYVKSCHIRVKLRGRDELGLIFPPLVKVKYEEIDLDDGNLDRLVSTSFSIDYEQPDGVLMKPIEIWSGILGALAVLIALLQAWSSIRRDSVTLPTSAAAPIWFLRCLCLHAAGRLADAALIIAVAASLRTFILFKGQSVPYITLPVVPLETVLTGEDVPEEDMLIKTYIIVSFSLKCIEILHMLGIQGSMDIFFLDWERPRPMGTSFLKESNFGKKSFIGGGDAGLTSQPVSAWRMCFIANEWNELQAKRRTSTLFQIVGVLFLLKVVGFEHWALPHPDLKINPDNMLSASSASLIFHVAVGIIIYFIVYSCQILFVVIYEHYGKNSIQDFVDLCSMANISVIILPWLHFGFYLHGRSAHGFADTDLATLKDCLRKEAEDVCGTRGLVPDGMERQTFRIAVPSSFRVCYDRILSSSWSTPVNISSSVGGGSYPSGRRSSPSGIWGGRVGGNGIPGPSSGFTDGSSQAYEAMNKFLSAFLEHALKDIDYEVRDKVFIETLLDIEMNEPLEHGIFYNDNGHSFDQVLLYGNEITLAAFNLLTFMFADALFLDYSIACILTIVVDKVIVWIRSAIGRRNISQKGLIDERFLI